MDAEQVGNVLLVATVYGGMVLAAFWLGMIIWTYRDMRARSRDSFAQILVAVMVMVLTLPGLLIYLMLRPRETLAEAYERSLEEEALLQEIEEKPACPGCGQRVHIDWQLCPHCHTRLKKPCVNCRQMLELSWSICPYCAANQSSSAEQSLVSAARPAVSVPQQPYPPQWTPQPAVRYGSTAAGQNLEFVENDEY